MFRFILLFTLSICFLFSAEEVPKETGKIMDSYDKVYTKALSSAQRSIDKEKEKALKALGKELIKAKRIDLELVEKIKKQIAEITALPTLLEMETDSKKAIEVETKVEEETEEVEESASDDSGFFDGIEDSKGNKSAEGGAITYDKMNTMHNKLVIGRIENFPNFDKYSKMYGLGKLGNGKIVMPFDKHPEIIKWIKDNDFVFTDDFLKEKCSEMYKENVRVLEFYGKGFKVNGLAITDKKLFLGKAKGKGIKIDFLKLCEKLKKKLDK